ncbi:MAG: hypothetical protein AB7N70_37860 [Dehalococcoidia bacterium]
MEKIVNFRDDQAVQQEDFANLQTFVRQSIDDVVKDGIDGDRKYAGLTVAQTGPTTVTVDPGRLYSAGAVYVIEASSVIAMLSKLPVVTQKIATIVVWGTTEEEDIQPRAFLINVDENGQEVFEPSEVTMRTVRRLNVDAVFGTESASPQRGAISSSVLPICDVLLDTSGVVSVTMDETTKLSSVAECKLLIDLLQDWQEESAIVIDGLRSDISRLERKIPADPAPTLDAIMRMIDDLTHKLNKPPTAVETFIDRFRNADESDPEHVGYAATIDDGLTFPPSGTQQIALSLLNPLEPRVATTSNITLPAHTEVEQSIVDPKWAFGHVLITNYPIVTLNYVRCHLSRRSVRYGNRWYSEIASPANAYTVLTNWLGRTVALDPESIYGVAELARRPELSCLLIKRGGGELYTHRWDDFWRYERLEHLDCRKGHRWRQDCYRRPYWRAVVSTSSGAGAAVAQSWLQPATKWLKSVRLYFRDKAASGDLTVSICETFPDGSPDETKVISSGSLVVASVNTGLDGVRIPVIPCIVEAGQRYAMIISTSGAHSLRRATDYRYSQGALWYRTSSDVWVDSALSDICFKLGTAKFTSTRQEVQMTSPQLVGGISDIRVAAAAYEPEGSSLTIEVQTGGVWRELDDDDEIDALTGGPAVVPLRLVFNGTYDIQPGIDLTQSEVESTATATAFEHWSVEYEPANPTDRVDIVTVIEGWKAASHTLTCDLTIGGTPAGVDATTTEVDPLDPSKIKMTFQFNLTDAADFTIKLVGGTSAGNGFFEVVERRAHIYPGA